MATSRRKLPIRLHLKSGGYYYVYQNKWTLLSRDYSDALRLYAGYMSPNTGKVPALIDRWLAGKKLAPKTLKTYAVVARKLKTAFEAFRPDQVKPSHLYQYIAAKSITTGMASHYRSVMIGAMQLAVEEGLIDQNPIKEVKNYVSRSRDRYLTDAEYDKIHAAACKTMQVVMSLCYYTGQRIGDVLSIRYADIGPEGIMVKQEKTGTRLRIAWSPQLMEAVATARTLHTNVKGLTLLHTRKGTKFTYSTIRTFWDRAVAKTGIEDAHMHDIRAKAATDADKQGIDSKALLGHKSEAVHLRYLRDKEIPIVQPVKMVRS